MKRVSGSTLMETLVAILIIAIVIMITSTIYANVSQSNTTYKKTKWNAICQSYLNESSLSDQIANEEITYDNYLLKSEIFEYQKKSDLMVVQVSIIEEGKEVYSVRKILHP